jgi:hypothetical protein
MLSSISPYQIKHITNPNSSLTNKLIIDNKNHKNVIDLKYYINLEELICDSSYEISIININNCKKLRLIKFGYWFNNINGTIFNLIYCYNLTTIIFDFLFNSSIKDLAFCTKLEYIKFGKFFNKSIKCFKYCKNLTIIIFGNNFDKSIESLSYCKNLKYIKFGGNFNQSIHPLKNCKLLHSIIFDDSNNQWLYNKTIIYTSLINLQFCSHLMNIECPSHYLDVILNTDNNDSKYKYIIKKTHKKLFNVMYNLKILTPHESKLFKCNYVNVNPKIPYYLFKKRVKLPYGCIIDYKN